MSCIRLTHACSTSMLLQYTTATLKNFAAPIGIILNCLLSRTRPDAPSLTPRFIYGTALVVLALAMYGASG